MLCSAMLIYEGLWIFMETYGSLCRAVQAYEVLCRAMENCGGLWSAT